MSAPITALSIYPGSTFERSLVHHEVRRYQARSSIAASSLTSTPIFANPVDLSAYLELTFFLEASATLSGTPAGVKLWLQMSSGASNTSYVDHLDFTGGLAVTVNSNLTGTVALARATNFGDMVQFGVSATTAWTGGTLALYVKAKS